jgi:mannose-6-phosphate isomerase-like protein (cupin superfamily)
MITSRPWGGWELLHKSDTYAVKRLVVKPQSRLSLQYHNHRKEHWYCVAGRGIVTINDVEQNIDAGDSVTIPLGTTHRLENISSTEYLVIVEVQEGIYLEEDDIVRIEDDYERN